MGSRGSIKPSSFRVIMKKSEAVTAAAIPLQENRLPLSNLDLILPPVYFSVFFCYDSVGHPAAGTTVGALKEGLSRALVQYYPLAGELVTNSGGEPEIRCNNRGVEFLEACADVDLRELDLYRPDESVEGKLVPPMKKNHGVLAVQGALVFTKPNF